MKAHVLLLSQNRALQNRLRADVGSLCHVHVSASPAGAYTQLAEKPFEAVIVDAQLPHFDPLNFVDALRHAPAPGPRVVSWGYLVPVISLPGPRTWEFVAIPHSIPSAIGTVRALLDPAAARTIEAVRYQPKEDTFFVAFRNGKTYELSRKVIEADDGGAAVVGQPRVVDGGDAFLVRLANGQQYDVAADFVLYHHEPTYPYHKDRPDQRTREARSAERIGRRVREAREGNGLTLEALARKTGMQVSNLSRLEHGKHLPSLETLERVAAALGARVADLVAV